MVVDSPFLWHFFLLNLIYVIYLVWFAFPLNRLWKWTCSFLLYSWAHSCNRSFLFSLASLVPKCSVVLLPCVQNKHKFVKIVRRCSLKGWFMMVMTYKDPILKISSGLLSLFIKRNLTNSRSFDMSCNTASWRLRICSYCVCIKFFSLVCLTLNFSISLFFCCITSFISFEICFI